MKILVGAILFLALAGALFVSTAHAKDDGKNIAEQRPELGHVRWIRDLAAAKKTSADTKRPVFLLFQEVPG